MPKKRVLTPEQLEKNRANLAKARAAKVANKEVEPHAPEPQVVPVQDSSNQTAERPAVKPVDRNQPVPEGIHVPSAKVAEQAEEQGEAEAQKPQANDSLFDLVAKLQREIEELKSVNPQLGQGQVDPNTAMKQMAAMGGVQLGPQGITSRVFKYPVAPDYYPDPTDRLYDDPKLRRFAMRENFYFKWEVTGMSFEKHNVEYNEPQFMVELWAFIRDDEGEPTGRMWLVSRQIQFEDELISRIAADKLGIKEWEGDTPEEKFRNMMDEVRYLRIRQWLLGVFTPFKKQLRKEQTRQEVIGGKVVEVKDVETPVDKASGIEQAATVEREAKLSRSEREAFNL